MDAQQFELFMKTFSEQQKVFLETINTQLQCRSEKSIQDNPVNYSSIAPFENFDPNREKFSCYLERFDNYYTMKGVTDEEKIAQLLCVSIGSSHYNKLAAFLGPEKPLKSLSYDDLIKSFKTLLIPRKNAVVSQHYFLNIYQTEHQSISEFVATLQRDIAECEFSVKCQCDKPVSISDVFLRAQFIRGLRDDWVREHILQSDKKTFQDILALATALEASRIESKELTQRSNPARTFSASEINKMSSSNQTRSRSRPRRPDSKALGIDNLCLRCSRGNHQVSECRVDKSKLYCNLCEKKGHVARVCITSLMTGNKRKSSKSSSTHSLQIATTSSGSTPAYGLNKLDTVIQRNDVIVDLFELNHRESDKYMIDVSLNGKLQRFEVDSGAKFTLLSENEFDRLNLNLSVQPTNLAFRSYSGNVIQSKGKVPVKAAYNGKQITSDLYIVPTGYEALLGRQWIRGLDIELKNIDNSPLLAIYQINSSTSLKNIIEEFSSIFEPKIGCVPGYEVSLQLKPGAKPCYTKERNVPYALLDQVNRELDELEVAGIIEPVDASDWGSPLVVIVKPDGGVRLCSD